MAGDTPGRMNANGNGYGFGYGYDGLNAVMFRFTLIVLCFGIHLIDLTHGFHEKNALEYPGFKERQLKDLKRLSMPFSRIVIAIDAHDSRDQDFIETYIPNKEVEKHLNKLEPFHAHRSISNRKIMQSEKEHWWLRGTGNKKAPLGKTTDKDDKYRQDHGHHVPAALNYYDNEGSTVHHKYPTETRHEPLRLRGQNSRKSYSMHGYANPRRAQLMARRLLSQRRKKSNATTQKQHYPFDRYD